MYKNSKYSPLKKLERFLRDDDQIIPFYTIIITLLSIIASIIITR